MVLIGLLLIATVHAAEPYQQEGTVEVSESAGTKVMINYQQYQIDRNTLIHGVTRRGELGPILIVGQRVGFNIEQNFGDLPRITEAWVLE